MSSQDRIPQTLTTMGAVFTLQEGKASFRSHRKYAHSISEVNRRRAVLLIGTRMIGLKSELRCMHAADRPLWLFLNICQQSSDRSAIQQIRWLR
jgi:hypothetical protein